MDGDADSEWWSADYLVKRKETVDDYCFVHPGQMGPVIFEKMILYLWNEAPRQPIRRGRILFECACFVLCMFVYVSRSVILASNESGVNKSFWPGKCWFASFWKMRISQFRLRKAFSSEKSSTEAHMLIQCRRDYFIFACVLMFTFCDCMSWAVCVSYLFAFRSNSSMYWPVSLDCSWECCLLLDLIYRECCLSHRLLTWRRLEPVSLIDSCYGLLIVCSRKA